MVLAAVGVAAAFVTMAPPTVEAPLAVVALAVPSFVQLGEGAAAIGAATLPEGFEGVRHFVVCPPEGSCRTGPAGRLAGSGPWHGIAGTIAHDAEGPLDVTWLLSVDIGLDGGRAVAAARATSEVRAAVWGVDAAP